MIQLYTKRIKRFYSYKCAGVKTHSAIIYNYKFVWKVVIIAIYVWI